MNSQRMLINGFLSNWTEASSRLLQGSVLGSVFHIFNDLDKHMGESFSNLQLTKIGGGITNKQSQFAVMVKISG